MAGYSGVGKTSLVREIQKDVIEKQGAYIEGKFDQLRRTQTLLRVGAGLHPAGGHPGWHRVRPTLLIGETPSWNAVGDHGQVLIDVIPALEHPWPAAGCAPSWAAVENQNRINHFFNVFIACLATPEHPLVVFLDDLQWIDPASLNLIEALLHGPEHEPPSDRRRLSKQ